jgi:hypothetical protein
LITSNSRRTHRVGAAQPPRTGRITEADLDDLQRTQWAPRAVTPTRRSLWHRLCRRVRIASLRYRIWETERYMDREATGVIDTRSMREFERQLAVWRVELAIAEQS